MAGPLKTDGTRPFAAGGWGQLHEGTIRGLENRSAELGGSERDSTEDMGCHQLQQWDVAWGGRRGELTVGTLDATFYASTAQEEPSNSRTPSVCPRMKGQSIAAHVKAIKGERSRLAELATELL